tara:strand:- start:1446 stop:1979 length:534 start_codon:yes stop_codon:yes gene_type:complete
MANLDSIRSINGANALVQIDGSTIGYATGVTVNEVYGLQRIDVLGEIDSRDIEPIGRVVNVQITFIRMIPTNQDTEGTAGGGSARRGLTPDHTQGDDQETRTESVTDFFQKGFDLKILDSGDFQEPDAVDSKKGRYLIEGCRPASQSFALSRGTLMGINVNCEALRLTELDSTNNAS